MTETPITTHRSLSCLLALSMGLSLVPAYAADAFAADTADAAVGGVQTEAVDYTAESTAVFSFSDAGIEVSSTVDESAYSIDGCDLTIKAAGTYVVSGSCADGGITVKKGTTGVTLVLNGLVLTSSDTAVIACNKSTGVNIVAAAGTANVLADSEQNNDDNYPDNENAENAVIKCKDGSQVTLSGEGELTIQANGKNGIKSGATTEEEGEASLTIEDLTLNITAPVNDAINAEQLLNVNSGNITINAADDAIHSDLVLNIGEEGTAGPTITVTGCYEGLEGATLNVRSGDIDITSTDDSLNAANSDLTDYGYEMNISGGTLSTYSTEGDGFDSNGSLTISGGTVVVWTANTADNQPLDADGEVNITGGTVLAAGGSNGTGLSFTTTQPYVAFGSTGGMGGDQGGQGGQPGDGTQPGQGGQGGTQPGQGGQGDGTTPPAKPGESTGATDASMASTTTTSTTDVTSATDAAAQPGQPGDQGGQGGQPDGQGGSTILAANEAFTIQDASGNTVYSGTAACNAAYLLYCSADLTEGASYTLSSASASVGTATAQTGTSQGGGAQPGQPGDGGQPGQPGDQGGQGQFSDVDPTAWYASGVQDMSRRGLMTGYSDTNIFGVGNELTRAELAMILWRSSDMAAAQAYDAASTDNATGMGDVEGYVWYTGAANWAVGAGVIQGYADAVTGLATFGPNDGATFEQVIVMLANYLATDDAVAGADASALANFTDGSSVSDWAKQAMAWAVSQGIVTGSDNGDGTYTLYPQQTIARERAATLLSRAL